MNSVSLSPPSEHRGDFDLQPVTDGMSEEECKRFIALLETKVWHLILFALKNRTLRRQRLALQDEDESIQDERERVSRSPSKAGFTVHVAEREMDLDEIVSETTTAPTLECGQLDEGINRFRFLMTLFTALR